MNPEGHIPGWKSYKFTGGKVPSSPSPFFRFGLGIGIMLSTFIFLGVFMLAGSIVKIYFTHYSKPAIQLVDPRPACKICHCGETSCHRNCGEENMCNLKCEGLCQKKK